MYFEFIRAINRFLLKTQKYVVKAKKIEIPLLKTILHALYYEDFMLPFNRTFSFIDLSSIIIVCIY